MLKIEKIYNAQTGEETIVEREETLQEKFEREASELEFQKLQSEAAAKETARAEILAKLGLTEDEAKVLLG